MEKYKDKLPGFIKILEEQAQYSIIDPRYFCTSPKGVTMLPLFHLKLICRVDYIFSTVHKFKGLECDTVTHLL